MKEQNHCEFCGDSFNGRFYGKGSYYIVLQCPNCNLLWANPLINDEYLKLINSAYRDKFIYQENKIQQSKRFRKQLLTSLKLFENFSENSKILEVGSGLGYFLDICEEAGIDCQGCDINEEVVRICNEKKNRSRVGSLDEFYGNNSFDMIFAFNLIEHLPNPKLFITECNRVLKKGGLLLIETPVQESLPHIFARLGDILTNYKLNYYGINTNGHIFKFSVKTFQQLTKSGFEILYKKNIGSPFMEIFKKTKHLKRNNKILTRIFIPGIWIIAKLFKKENRIFIVLKKQM